MDPVTQGKEIAELLWWSLAKRIMGLAENLYKWDETQWQDANEKFLKPSDYKVVMGD